MARDLRLAADGAATLIVGPVSFIGLMAPHLPRMLGLRCAETHLAGAVLVGALLLAMADWLPRLVFFPSERRPIWSGRW